MAGDALRDSGIDKQIGAQLAGMIGSYSTIFTGNAIGLDEKEISENMHSGQRIGSNAAQNNSYYDDVYTPPGVDENMDEIEKGRKLVGKAVYEATPMGVNKNIEATRGSEQTLYAGGAAVYKSGNEWNGVVDPTANNIGLGNIPKNQFRKIDLKKIGKQVDFGSGFKGFRNKLFSLAEGSYFSEVFNYGVIGMNDTSLTHDYFAGHWAKKYPQIPTIISNQGSIVPIYFLNTYGLIGKPLNMAEDYINNLLPNNTPRRNRKQVNLYD